MGTVFIFSGIELSGSQVAAMQAANTYTTYLRAETMRVVAPYMVLGAVTIIWAVLIALTRFPVVAGEHQAEGESHGRFRDLLGYPTFLFAVVAQFLYVGAQVGTWSYFIQYVQDSTHQRKWRIFRARHGDRRSRQRFSSSRHRRETPRGPGRARTPARENRSARWPDTNRSTTRGPGEADQHRQLGDGPAAWRQHLKQQRGKSSGGQQDDKHDKSAAGRHEGPFHEVGYAIRVEVARGFVTTKAEQAAGYEEIDVSHPPSATAGPPAAIVFHHRPNREDECEQRLEPDVRRPINPFPICRVSAHRQDDCTEPGPAPATARSITPMKHRSPQPI